MTTNVKQNLLNISVAHVLKQGRPSATLYGDKVTCLYRSPEGLQCAAGPFIKDYDPDMENKSFSTLAKHDRFRDRLQDDARAHAEFVDMLQAAHDFAADAHFRYGAEFITEYKTRLAGALLAQASRYMLGPVSLKEAYSYAAYQAA